MKSPLRNVTGKSLSALITLATSCGFLLFGFDQGVFSGILIAPWFLNTFDHPSPSLTGTVSATYNLGGALGGLIAFLFGDYLGRRKTTILGDFFGVIGAVLQASSTSIAQLLVGRIVTGVGVGLLTSTVGLWQAETAPPKSRGRYLTLQLMLTVLGLFLSQWINYGFNGNTGRIAFAFPLSFQLVFLAIMVVLVLMLPESPRWLVKHNRQEEALVILQRLERHNAAAVAEGGAEKKLYDIIQAEKLERAKGSNIYKEIFTNGPTQNFQRLALAVTTMVFHQICGSNSITYYLPLIIQSYLDASQATSLWLTGLTSPVALCGAIIPVIFIDRVGRRAFLWGGALAQAVIFAIIAALIAQLPPGGDHSYGIALVFLIIGFYFPGSMCWLGPSWAYPAEILPLRIREKAMGIGNIFYWLFSFLMVEVTPIALKSIGYKFYVILTVINIGIVIVVYFWFPETKAKSLEEIDFYFASKYHGGAELREVESEMTRQKEEGGFAVAQEVE